MISEAIDYRIESTIMYVIILKFRPELYSEKAGNELRRAMEWGLQVKGGPDAIDKLES